MFKDGFTMGQEEWKELFTLWEANCYWKVVGPGSVRVIQLARPAMCGQRGDDVR